MTQELTVSQEQQLLRNTKVREVMCTEIETTEPDEDITVAGRLMLENKFGCLPVTEGLKLVGILTESDFIRYAIEELV